MTLEFPEERLITETLASPLMGWARYDLDWNNGRGDKLEVPDYQRDFVWSEEQYAEFIASIFDRVPPPAVIIDNRDWTKLVVVDGKHRLKALIRFYNDDLEVKGTKYSELEEITQREFDLVVMSTVHAKHLTDKEIIQLYITHNFTRVPHRDQDRRRADMVLKRLTPVTTEEVFTVWSYNKRDVQSAIHYASDEEKTRCGLPIPEGWDGFLGPGSDPATCKRCLKSMVKT